MPNYFSQTQVFEIPDPLEICQIKRDTFYDTSYVNKERFSTKKEEV